MWAPGTSTRPYAALLAALAALFLLRVVGQALVAFFRVAGLPPMGEWYSGLLPYPLLLPIQALILAGQGWICADFARGAGYWVRPRPGWAGGSGGSATVMPGPCSSATS